MTDRDRAHSYGGGEVKLRKASGDLSALFELLAEVASMRAADEAEPGHERRLVAVETPTLGIDP